MAAGTWTLLREARDDTWPDVVYFRVHVVFNAHTGNYVLWVNLNKGGGGDYAVGTSRSPEGPFTFVHAITLERPSGGDFDILVDDDGAGYIIYTETRGHTMAVEKLTADFLASAAVPTPPPPPPPTPTPDGFRLVGNGACRDHSRLEPPFDTNEPQHKAGFTAAACAAACTAAASCSAYSFCGANRGCDGACHLYMSVTRPPMNATWMWNAGSGGHLPVTRVTAETWWNCYAKEHVDGEATGLLSAPRDITAPSNVSSGVIGNVFVEAPAIFKRNGIYYALFDNCCCFCAHGSGIGVYTATAPLGPWKYWDNIGCTANTTLTPGCGCGMDHSIPGGGKCSFYGDSITKAQQNFVIQIPRSTDGSIQYVWTGDRWQSASDGIKAHDLQYWSVLRFADTGTGIDLPQQFLWQDKIYIDLY